MLKEFQEFISRGNVLDLAIGIIIGAAFGKIVTSIVDDVLMPLIGMLVGGVNFSGLSLTFRSSTISYGAFLQSTIDFLIIAFCVFMIVKFVNRLKKKEEIKEAKTGKTDDIILLEEIRDLLKKKK